jgi:hypothetical protein
MHAQSAFFVQIERALVLCNANVVWDVLVPSHKVAVPNLAPTMMDDEDVLNVAVELG